MIEEFLILFIAGAFGGFLAGFLGVGGGIIYIVIIPEALRQFMQPLEEELGALVVANSFFAIFFSSLFASLTHVKINTFYWRESLYVGIPATVTALVFQTYLVNTPIYTYDLYNLMVIGILMLVVAFTIYRAARPAKQSLNSKASWQSFSFAGIASGLVSILTGLGGAVVLIPILRYLKNIDIKMVRSISIAMILMMSFCITLINMTRETDCDECLGLINWNVTIPLILATLLFSPLGVKISHKISKKWIEITFVVFLILVLTQKIWIYLR